jgi:hypothetical protein
MEGLEFMAIVTYCTPGGSCYRCSGSLIAPNVVLTAGHCVRDMMVPFGDQTTIGAASEVRVTLGSTNWESLDAGASVYTTKKIIFGTFGTNIRYPFDGDIALLELSTCVSERPYLIQYARVATWETEPSRSGCTNVTVAGYGRVSNVPEPLNDDDGQLRSITDKVHSADVCRKSFAALRLGYEDARLLDMQSVSGDVSNAILGDNYICTGGGSLQSVCFGDSGGPTFTRLSDGRAQIVGITSFGIGDNYCTLGPDFATRVAFYADWIKEQMTRKFSTCLNYDFSTSFASNPLVAYPASQLSVEWRTSRCTAGKWQCKSGECIDTSKVCDNAGYNCADESDEEYSFDSVSLCSAATRRLEEQSSRIVTGRPFIQLGFPVEGEEQAPEAKAYVTCTRALSNVNTAINAAKAQNTIADIYWDPTAVIAACTAFGTCLRDASVDTSSYADASDQCTAILSWSRQTQVEHAYASAFGTVFNAACPDDKYVDDMGGGLTVVKKAAKSLSGLLAVVVTILNCF